jgi:hypothetical protein
MRLVQTDSSHGDDMYSFTQESHVYMGYAEKVNSEPADTTLV